MASDGTGAKDPIEGYHDGKRLEMIQKPNILKGIQKTIKEQESKVSEEHRRKEEDLTTLQDELNELNKNFVEQCKKLEKLKSTKQVALEVDEQDDILKSTKEALERFLHRRDPPEKEQNMTAFVDVHFQPGNETTGTSLHIGGEGAGSRDAKFTVQVNEKVETLAKQSAKYWGLDANMVFFLDRDGRIVPDKMLLRDIILPPLPTGPQDQQPPASSSTALMAIPEGGQLETIGGKTQDAWTVLDRNYRLTLVRATTVLDKEDLNKPKGETWNDFTFKAAELQQELEQTRKKRGDADPTGGKVQNLEDLPSLNKLIQEGLEKKAKKRADTRCRMAEFTIFLLAELIFYVTMLRPDARWMLQMRLMSHSVDRKVTTFTNEERNVHFIQSYDNISTLDEYLAWLNGPLKRSIIFPAMEVDNLFVMGVISYKYEAAVEEEKELEWCTKTGAGVDDNAECLNSSNGSNASNASNGSNASNASNCSTAADASTARRMLREQPEIEPRQLADVCVPDVLKTCRFDYAVKILADGIRQGLEVPGCEQPWTYGDHEALFMSFGSDHEPFSHVNGVVKIYAGGVYGQWNISNITSYEAAVQEYSGSMGTAHNIPAQMLVMFVYNPTLNGMLVKRLLVEKTFSGAYVTSKRQVMLRLDTGDPVTDAGCNLVAILTIFVFLMEMRRIFRWPRRWFSADLLEDNHDRCGFFSFVFGILPVVVLATFSFYRARFSVSANDVITYNSDMQLTKETIEKFSMCEMLDNFILGLNLLTLLMFNSLFFRYLLMYFPQLVFLTSMVKKVAKPILFLLTLLLIALFCFGCLFYSLYGSKHYAFRSFLMAAMSTFRMAQGGFDNWYDMYLLHPFIWTASIAVAFVLITLIMNNLVVAIMLSHKKEKDLFENYSYHTFWASERSQAKDPKEFNAARVGYDFSDGPKEPRIVSKDI